MSKKESLIKLYYDEIMKDIKPSWYRILHSPTIKPVLHKCLTAIDVDLLNKGVTIERVKENGIHNYIRPEPRDILAPFKQIDAHNVRAFGFGQDPYPGRNIAMGMSFSTRSAKTPPSLGKIYACLRHKNLVQAVTTNDLTGWAKQGIIMLNLSLTRTPNIVKSTYRDELGMVVTNTSVEGEGGQIESCKHKFWEEFTITLIKYLTEVYYPEILKTQKRNIYFMLWGNDAAVLENHIKATGGIYGFRVLTWGHPSPLNRQNTEGNPENFINCDHFTRISSEYSINWNPGFVVKDDLNDRFLYYRAVSPRLSKSELTRVLETGKKFEIYDDGTNTEENMEIKKYIAGKAGEIIQVVHTKKPFVFFVDGGCRNNGKENATASYGVYFPAKYNSEDTITGEKSISGKLSEFNQVYDIKNNCRVNQESRTKQTNQRAELTAVLVGLEHLLTYDTNDISNIVMVTDSKQYVLSWTGNGRLWVEYQKDKKFTDIPNKDLVVLLARYILMLARKIKGDCGILESKDILLNSGFWNIYWTSSHKTREEMNALSGIELEHANGNIRADDLCNSVY